MKKLSKELKMLLKLQRRVFNPMKFFKELHHFAQFLIRDLLLDLLLESLQYGLKL